MGSFRIEKEEIQEHFIKVKRANLAIDPFTY